jgi:hypothetical protein
MSTFFSMSPSAEVFVAGLAKGKPCSLGNGKDFVEMVSTVMEYPKGSSAGGMRTPLRFVATSCRAGVDGGAPSGVAEIHFRWKAIYGEEGTRHPSRHLQQQSPSVSHSRLTIFII